MLNRELDEVSTAILGGAAAENAKGHLPGRDARIKKRAAIPDQVDPIVMVSCLGFACWGGNSKCEKNVTKRNFSFHWASNPINDHVSREIVTKGLFGPSSIRQKLYSGRILPLYGGLSE